MSILPKLIPLGAAVISFSLISTVATQVALAVNIKSTPIAVQEPEPEESDRAPGLGLPGLGLEVPLSGKPVPKAPEVVDDEPGEDGTTPGPGPASPSDGTAKLPQVNYGEEGLPRPVARLRAQILDAARTGDVERLRPVIEANEVPPTFSFAGTSDPIAHLKEASGDDHGREALAILIEVLEAGWILADPGTPQEMYVWPYFARYPFDKLTPEQMVELFKIITAGDYQDMQSYGTYIFYRLGIGPDGTWHFFVAGD
jgi:hypothetical protein